MDAYDRHEAAVALGYYDDPRWEQVYKLREEEKHLEANSLVMQIRDDWGI